MKYEQLRFSLLSIMVMLGGLLGRIAAKTTFDITFDFNAMTDHPTSKSNDSSGDSPAGGNFTEAQNVTINCATEGATIYYTTDGSNPTTSSAVYSTPIAIFANTTLKAIAMEDGVANSEVATATYNFEAEAPSKRVTVITQLDDAETTATVGTVIPTIDDKTVTITVTPADGYYFTNNDLSVEPVVDAGIAQARRRAASNGPGYAGGPSVNAGQGNSLTGTSTFTFDLDEEDDKICYLVTANFHTRISLETATVTVNGGPWTYTGDKHEPGVTVKLNNTDLTPTTDYTVSYAKNTNAGQGEITVTGQGKYINSHDVTKFTIVPATLTVTADNKEITFGDAAPTDYSVTYSGFVNGEDKSVLSGTLSCTCSYQQGDDAKDYAITPGGYTVGNYKYTYQNGKLTVNPKSVTVTAQDKAFNYTGEAQSWNQYDVDGLVGSDAISAVVEGSITFPSQSPVTNKLKSYSFTTGKAGNYSVTTADGELTMTNASVAITITAASQSWTYDGSAHTAPTVTVTSGSLLTGDELVAEATGSVTDVADTNTDNNPVKSGYKVMHGDQDVTSNYVITAVAGTLTVAKADIPAEAITAPVVIEGLIFDGELQTLIEAGSVADAIGTMLYSLDQNTWSEELPQASAVGSHTVYYKVVGDANHNDVAVQTVTAVIADMPMEDALQKLYDAIYHAATVLSDGQYTHPKDACDALTAVIYDAAELYVAAEKEDSEVTPTQIVAMIKRLQEAEEIFLNSGVTTGIWNVNGNVDGNCYDLQGRRVVDGRLLKGNVLLKKGKHIVNGKIVIVK